MRTFLTVLRSADRVLDAIVLVRRLTACGLEAARDLVARPGQQVTGPLDRRTAEAVVALLAKAGSTAEVVSAGEQLLFFRPDDPRGADQPLERLTRTGRTVLVEQGSLAGFAEAAPVALADEAAAERRFAGECEARFEAGLVNADDPAEVHRQFAQRNAELDARLRAAASEEVAGESAEVRSAHAGARLLAGAIEEVAGVSAGEPAEVRSGGAGARLRAGAIEEVARVYADWLLERGDPRGELMALQLAGRAREADAVLAAHRGHILGGLAALGDLAGCEWRHGLLDGLRVNPGRRRRHDAPDLGRPGRLAQWARALERLPAAVALRTLHVAEDADLWLAVGLTVPATVERLLLWAGQGGVPATTSVASPLAGLERLTWLSLDLGLDGEDLAAPRVEHLELRTSALRAGLGAVDPERLPALRTLSLDLGEGEPLRFHPDAEVFERLLARLAGSTLRHLVVTATPRGPVLDAGFMRPVVEALLRWPGLDALETLELKPNLPYGEIRQSLQRRVRLVERG